MRLNRRRTAIVLGAGDGTRLSALTTRGGVAVPKQFCTLNGSPSLLQLALRRAERVVGIGRVTTVVAAHHRRWWAREVPSSIVDPRIIVQPYNRGTAAGVLLPLADVYKRDPDATVFILPSDHWVAHERLLTHKLEHAGDVVESEPETVALLGIEPDSAEPGYGWILPGRATAPGVFRVDTFVEKPALADALELLAAGAVWNSFLLVARARTLWRLYEERLPELLERMLLVLAAGAPAVDARAEEMYAELPVHDFSRDVLAGAEDTLRLLRVPQCGWTDLGTPERVSACVERVLSNPAAEVVPRRPHARLDLALALAGA
jgi:mannose-1-phosphate guanylyltransferase